MPLRGELQNTSNFTGFIVTYENGSKIYEKNDYFSKMLNKKCATNWAEIDKSKIASLELHWEGVCKATINKAPSPDTHSNELTAKDWFFSHRGYLDMGVRKVVILSRNIGYVENGILYLISVIQKTGEVTRSMRPYDEGK